MRTLPLFSIVALSCSGVTLTAGAQGMTACNTEQQRQVQIKLPSGEYNNFYGGPVTVRCPSKSITLKADSAEIYGDEHRVYFVGHVHYLEPRLELYSDYLTYYQLEERILAVGNVDARLPTGSKLRGPQVDYRRVAPRIRTRAQALATGRPTVTIVQRDTSGKEQPPIDVVANTIFMDGDSLIYGSGAVQITRPEVNATSDSAFINTGTENMQLMRNPVVNGTRGRPFRLVGDRIELFSHDRKLERVISQVHAQANSQDFTLRSDTIDLRLANDTLEHAYAWGKGRAHALSPTQNMTSDSLDVRMPGQRVREVHAVRKAFAEGRPDTTKFHADTTDWLRGDTIFAYFDSLPPTDTSKGPEIRRLVASDSAQAYYHIAPNDTALHRPAINYVRGQVITIDFDSARVATIVVDGVAGKVAGIYLEPTADTTGTKANTRRGNTPQIMRPPSRSVPGVRRP
jgi:lipopolysaccharide export system protein LptA